VAFRKLVLKGNSGHW